MARGSQPTASCGVSAAAIIPSLVWRTVCVARGGGFRPSPPVAMGQGQPHPLRRVSTWTSDACPATATLPVYPYRILTPHMLAEGVCEDRPGTGAEWQPPLRLGWALCQRRWHPDGKSRRKRDHEAPSRLTALPVHRDCCGIARVSDAGTVPHLDTATKDGRKLRSQAPRTRQAAPRPMASSPPATEPWMSRTSFCDDLSPDGGASDHLVNPSCRIVLKKAGYGERLSPHRPLLGSKERGHRPSLVSVRAPRFQIDLTSANITGLVTLQTIFRSVKRCSGAGWPRPY